MGLWSYETTQTEHGIYRAARQTSMARLNTDGTGSHPVHLRFCDDPIGGHGCFLMFEAEKTRLDFGGQLRITIDDNPGFTVLATRPESDKPMFSLRNPRELWYRTRDAKLMLVDFPLRHKVRPMRASFDLRGLLRSHLGWDQHREAELRTPGFSDLE